jgi:hypothetical protein
MLQSLLYAADLHLALLVQFREKKLRTKRVCRYTRYANTLNIKPEVAAAFEGGGEVGGACGDEGYEHLKEGMVV